MSEWRDAAEVPPWRPEDGAPPYVHIYPAHLRPRVTICIDGSLHRAIATERRTYHDGRTALRLTLWPARRTGSDPRHGWFWWHPEAMRLESRATSPFEERVVPGDAVRVRPAEDFTRPMAVPDYRGYPHYHRPRLRVRVGGEWHDATVFHKVTYADGRVAVQVRMCFTEEDWPVHYWRHYWWDPFAMRLRRPDDPEPHSCEQDNQEIAYEVGDDLDPAGWPSSGLVR